MDVAAGHIDSPAMGVAAGVVSGLAAVRGIQNLRTGGLVHNIEGVGNLALAASSGMGAYEAFFSDHGGHHHHEMGLAGGLEMVHGLAEMAVGGIELKRGGRKALSLTKMLKGGAVVAAQLIPGAAPLGHLVHLGACVAVAAMDPTH
jgi:hypothetical protein